MAVLGEGEALAWGEAEGLGLGTTVRVEQLARRIMGRRDSNFIFRFLV